MTPHSDASNLKSDMDQAVTFQASLARISTTIDGGWKVTFDVPQSDAESMLLLSEYREKILQIGIVIQPEDGDSRPI